MFWTLDKVVRVELWGGVSALLATVLSALGIVSWLLGFTTLWLITAAVYMYTADMKEPAVGKSVVVTGCDRGFGHALALHLDKLGFRVFAGCLQAEGEGAKHLRQEGSSRLHVLQMDVTNQEQLNKAAQEIKSLLPEGEGVWGLVNNAGVLSIGPVEWTTMENFRKLSEVNVFGLIAATKTFLPLVRRARGRVVNVSSIAGRFSYTFMGAYGATKYAVEGFSDVLRQEMSGFGVKVCIIEPGNFAGGTLLFGRDLAGPQQVKAMLATVNDDVKKDYGEDYHKRLEGFVKNIYKDTSKDISPVINAYTEALTQTYPQDRYCPMSAQTYTAVFVNTHFPAWVFDTLFGG